MNDDVVSPEQVFHAFHLAKDGLKGVAARCASIAPPASTSPTCASSLDSKSPSVAHPGMGVEGEGGFGFSTFLGCELVELGVPMLLLSRPRSGV